MEPEKRKEPDGICRGVCCLIYGYSYRGTSTGFGLAWVDQVTEVAKCKSVQTSIGSGFIGLITVR